MMGFGLAELLVVLLSAGGAGNDLLDYLDTRAYWKLKGIEVTVENMTRELAEVQSREVARLIRNLGADDFKTREEATRKLRSIGAPALGALKKAAENDDPEVRSRAREILKTVSKAARAKAVRRLMAIRALGELGNKAALPPLRELLGSREPFVADYAGATVARLEGKKHARAVPRPSDLAADLRLLPPGCGVVAQAVMKPGAPLDWDKTFAQVGNLMPPGLDLAEVKQKVATALANVAEQVGNFRLQAITFGLAAKIGDQSGFAVVVARGIYDPEAVAALLRQQEAAERKISGQSVFAVEREMMLIPSGGGRFVFAAGPKPEAIPVAEVAARLARLPEKAAFDEALLARARAGGGPLWVAMKMSATYRQAPVFAPFDTLVLTTREEKDGALAFNVVARGKNAESVANAVGIVKNGLKEAREEIAGAVQQFPPAKTFLEILSSVKVEARGGEATLTARLKGAPGVLLSPFLMFTLWARATPPPPPPQEVPAPAPR